MIRVSVHKGTDDSHDHHAVADHFVARFADGSLHDVMPQDFPVAHVQRGEIGEWSCWFNWDSPDMTVEHEDEGDGDYEDVQHIMSHYTGDEAHEQICEGGAAPTGVHCQTADHVAWKVAGQTLKRPCSLSGIICLNKDNAETGGCKDFLVQCGLCVTMKLHLKIFATPVFCVVLV